MMTMDSDNKLTALQSGLCCHWVGPMPLVSFFDEFLETDDASLENMPDHPNDYFNALKESEMAQSFINLVFSSLITQGFELFDTRNGYGGDSDTKMKNQPDIVMYDGRIDVSRAQSTVYSQAEVIFEFFPKDNVVDPFDDPSEMATQDDLERFLCAPTVNERQACKARITRHAGAWMASQHRTHCFVVWIGDPYARIIRFDRDGAIVTELFDIRSQSRLLLEFLWRISCVSPEVRGKDTTVSIVTDEDEIKLAKENLGQWTPRSSRAQVMKFRIPHHLEMREVLAWSPLADPQRVVGRATRGYPAWDLTDRKLVFIKDSWRAVGEDISKETDILKALNDAEVCNVPKLVCGDDLPGQTTRTQEFAGAEWNKGGPPESFSRRAHIRFASDMIGIPLNKFKSSKDFVQAWLDALLAHEEAYTKCKILHRDISLDNIMFKPEGGGFLNDWDLARTLDDIEADPCRPSRFGTWQFISIALLGKPDKKHTLQDDLEAFFWVLLYVTLRYLLTSLADLDEPIRQIMQTIFDTAAIKRHATIGGAYKHQVVSERLLIGRDFHVTKNAPLSDLIDAIIRIFRVYRNFWSSFSDDVQSLVRKKRISLEAAKKIHLAENQEKFAELGSHDSMIELVRMALEKEWPTGDGPFDYCSVTSTQSNKRSAGPSGVECGPQQKRPKTET